jgi:hypothetical protein
MSEPKPWHETTDAELMERTVSGDRDAFATLFRSYFTSLLGDLIGIGVAVARRPLPNHRAYGSVHGGSSRLRYYHRAA